MKDPYLLNCFLKTLNKRPFRLASSAISRRIITDLPLLYIFKNYFSVLATQNKKNAAKTPKGN